VIGILLGVRKLIKSRTKEKENAEKKNNGEDPSEDDIIAEKAPAEGAQLDREMLSKEVAKSNIVDPNDLTTLNKDLDPFGNQKISEGGGKMFEVNKLRRYVCAQ
jgi:hypothetical protein